MQHALPPHILQACCLLVTPLVVSHIVAVCSGFTKARGWTVWCSVPLQKRMSWPAVSHSVVLFVAHCRWLQWFIEGDGRVI